jgi:phosphoglycerate dehydrogenase-like enzyme
MTGVLILHTDHGPYRNDLLPAFPEVEFWIHPTAPEDRDLPDEVQRRLPEADAIVSIGRWVSPGLLAQCTRLRWFQCAITGTDHLRPLLAATPVLLSNARGIHGPQMAETVVLHMLAAYRQVLRLLANQQSHRWDRFRPKVLETRTAAILGVGSIAEHVAGVCKAFGMRTLGLSRTPRPVPGFDEIRSREALLEVAATADVLIVLLPYTAENHHLVDRNVFAAMKPDAVLVNVSRGNVVNEADLLAALRTGEIGWAGLDVFAQSPLPADSDLWSEPNVFITPFIGGQSDLYEHKFVGIVRDNLTAFLAGRPDRMRNIVPLGGPD